MYIYLTEAPTRSLDGATPYDFLTRIKPNVEHFRIFRTFVNLKMLKEKLKKSQNMTQSMVLLDMKLAPKDTIVMIQRHVVYISVKMLYLKRKTMSIGEKKAFYGLV